jgi:hypothetical protein
MTIPENRFHDGSFGFLRCIELPSTYFSLRQLQYGKPSTYVCWIWEVSNLNFFHNDIYSLCPQLLSLGQQFYFKFELEFLS